MLRKTMLCGVMNFALMIALGITHVYAQDQGKDKKDKTNIPADAVAVMWQEPGDIRSRNLYWGAGGEAMKPDLSKVTFVKEETGGYSAKFKVRDGAGRLWVAKLGKEAQPETAANRLIWAVGYPTEISYLVPRVTIEGKGTFENVKFEARPEHVERADIWKWDDNPFKGSPQYQGLKIMMLLFNNWDIKDDNNKILLWNNPLTGKAELRYIISDLGATFGKTGNFITRSRNKPEDFVEAKFIDGVKGNYISFNYKGKRSELFNNISVEDARWIAQWLNQLSEEQIKDAFRAANYSPEEIDMLAQSFKARIGELLSLAPGQ